MKRLILLFFIAICVKSSYGQSDTIFTSTETILCNVKEVTPDAVKFTYPGEDLINTIYKNTVQKIVFRSGRVQKFSESSAYKTIKGVGDFNDVSLAQVESEILGLYKLGDLSSKAKGTTTLSNQERVKERAIKKLKIVAAMMGANVVFLVNQRTEGNKMGGYYQAGSTAETNFTGIGYTSQLPNYNDFVKKIGEKKDFEVFQKAELKSNATDLMVYEAKGSFKIISIENQNGLIILNGVLTGEANTHTFRVAYFDNEYFTLFYEDKNTSYNIIVNM